MIERCTFRHFSELTESQQQDMLAVLTGAHQTSHPEKLPQFAITGGRPVALLKDEKVIAALVTDDDNRIRRWVGRLDRKFKKEVGHTPAQAILRAHLESRGDHRLEFIGEPTNAATNLFLNSFVTDETIAENKIKTSKNGNLNTVEFSEDLIAKLKSKIPWDSKVWRIYSP